MSSSPDERIPQVASEHTLLNFKEKQKESNSQEHIDPEFYLRRHYDQFDEEKNHGPTPYHPVPQPPKPTFSNPNSLGLWSFATVTVLLATFNLFLPDKPNHIMLPSALVFGGLAQFIAGYMALFRNNTFGGTLFVSYGAFWAGSGLMMLPSVSSTLDAYGSAHDLAIATGIYKLFWSFFSLMNVCISLKVQGGNFMLTWCVSFVFLTLLFEGFGALFSLIPLIRVSGVTAYLAGLGAYYLGIVDLFEEQGVHLWMGVYKH